MNNAESPLPPELVAQKVIDFMCISCVGLAEQVQFFNRLRMHSGISQDDFNRFLDEANDLARGHTRAVNEIIGEFERPIIEYAYKSGQRLPLVGVQGIDFARSSWTSTLKTGPTQTDSFQVYPEKLTVVRF